MHPYHWVCAPRGERCANTPACANCACNHTCDLFTYYLNRETGVKKKQIVCMITRLNTILRLNTSYQKKYCWTGCSQDNWCTKAVNICRACLGYLNSYITLRNPKWKLELTPWGNGLCKESNTELLLVDSTLSTKSLTPIFKNQLEYYTLLQ